MAARTVPEKAARAIADAVAALGVTLLIQVLLVVLTRTSISSRLPEPFTPPTSGSTPADRPDSGHPKGVPAPRSASASPPIATTPR